jgi:hypothetical protein
VTVTRRGRVRGLRPLVLVAALIAPAILGSGLLVADVSGYDTMANRTSYRAFSSPPVVAGGPPARDESGTRTTVVHQRLLDPTIVPEPFGPARVYEGAVRLSAPLAAPHVMVRSRPRAEPKTKAPRPKEERVTCSPEWRDTWLWELCQEQGGHV